MTNLQGYTWLVAARFLRQRKADPEQHSDTNVTSVPGSGASLNSKSSIAKKAGVFMPNVADCPKN